MRSAASWAACMSRACLQVLSMCAASPGCIHAMYAQVFGVPISGTLVQEPWTTDGSGSTYLWGYLDSVYRCTCRYFGLPAFITLLPAAALRMPFAKGCCDCEAGWRRPCSDALLGVQARHEATAVSIVCKGSSSLTACYHCDAGRA